jgi:hypothetical protein
MNIMHETSIVLNTSEMNIIMCAFNTLSLSEEHRIAKEYGSVPALYSKIYSAWEKCGGKETVTQVLTDASY